jgi:hypothetical protein
METLAQQIRDAVLKDLLDRRGFRQAWDEVDEDIRLDIRGDLEQKIQAVLDDAGVKL